MPKSVDRKLPFSPNRRRGLTAPSRTQIVSPFAKRKISFDVNDDVDVTSRFLLSSTQAPGATPKSSIKQKDTLSNDGRFSTTRSIKSSKCSLTRLSRSGCLRLLDEGDCSTTEIREDQNPSIRRTVPSVSEDDMSIPSYNEVQSRIEIESQHKFLSAHRNARNYVSSCWGHFIDFHLSDLADDRRSHKHRNSVKTRSIRQSKDSTFCPYSKDKNAYPKSSLSDYHGEAKLSTTDDISYAMKRISLRNCKNNM
jgi:hypothetical protein